MQIVHTGEPIPTGFKKSIFLAGPSPRKPGAKTWRTEAIGLLRKHNYDGVVFSPEYKEGKKDKNLDYDSQIDWETNALNNSDCIVFWIPRDIQGDMPAFTTNDEWGMWKHSGKCVIGFPSWAEKISYQNWWADELNVPKFDNLEETIKNALNRVQKGALRTGGECEVPLEIWNRDDFQQWLKSQKSVGNRLDGCRVEWIFWVPSKAFKSSKEPVRTDFSIYSLHVNIHIASEKRNKVEECVVFRPDVSYVVLYRGSDIVLVREFRSSVCNKEGFVYELPGGSSQSSDDPKEIAVKEVQEEIGLKINTDDLRFYGVHQVCATLSPYKCYLYGAELNDEQLQKLEKDSKVHGVENTSERTFIEVQSIKNIMSKRLVDWSQLGMILFVLNNVN